MLYFYDNVATKETIKLVSVRPLKRDRADMMFIHLCNVKFKSYDYFSVLVGVDENGKYFPVTRMITYKKNPSKHVCNARCIGGKCGGTCECSCGGLNHGRGY